MAKNVVRRYNISAAKPYTDGQGQQKTMWVRLGTAVQFDDGSIVANFDSLPPGNGWDGSTQLFPQEQQQTQQRTAPQGYPSGGVVPPYGGGYPSAQPQPAPQQMGGGFTPQPQPAPAPQPQFGDAPF